MTITEASVTSQPPAIWTGIADDVLEGFRERAAVADRDNTYFHEDLAVLAEQGYLGAAVPRELGGAGLGVGELAAEQRRIARHAPATALGMCMHHYWVGIGNELRRAGDDSLDWLLADAARGSVIAAGHAERGNDMPILLSTAVAERVEGGYRISGHKMFGSNGPVWTYLGFHALDASDPKRPMVVHGFVRRDDEGVTVLSDSWDTLGMRPSQSYDTVLDRVFVPDERIGAVVPAGAADDLFLVGMDVWAMSLISAVYLGIADRALELAIDSARTKTSIAIGRGTYAHNPMVQHQVSQMVLALDAASAVHARFIADWEADLDEGDWWGARIASMKWHAARTVRQVVDLALEVTGGAGMYKRSELERLYRDARCAGFHPPNDALAHELVGKLALGVVDDDPRW